MRYPEFLRDRGRIGFIAPSFGAVIEPYNSLFKNALKKFGDLGYDTILGPNCFEDKGIGKSNTPESCGQEVNEFFTQDRCDVIMSCGGGETMCEDLPFIDFGSIAASRPKWFIGYSDNTNLTFTLTTICDTAAIYGPCAGSFGMEPWHDSIQDALDLLSGKKYIIKNYDLWERSSDDSETDMLASYNVTEPFDMKLFLPDGKGGGDMLDSCGRAEFEGRLIGGCMDCLQVLCGTEFDRAADFAERYADDGIIWFLESCDLTPMSVRRVIWQLENAGWFRNVRGFIIGRPLLMDADGMGFDRFTAVTGILAKYNVPVIMDADLGHLPPMMPMVSGAFARIKAEDNKLSIAYDFR